MSPAALSRREALLGVAALAAGPAVAADIGMPMTGSAASPGLTGPLTLAQTEALDFGALWASLPTDAQARIGELAIRNEFAQQVAQDGGFHTTRADRDRAEAVADQAHNALPAVIWAAFPDLLPVTHDEPYPLWIMLEGREPPVAVAAHGMGGERQLVGTDAGWFVPDGGRLVELGGAVNLNSRRDGAPNRWLFLTVADIDAERLRRHPEMATAGGEA